MLHQKRKNMIFNFIWFFFSYFDFHLVSYFLSFFYKKSQFFYCFLLVICMQSIIHDLCHCFISCFLICSFIYFFFERGHIVHDWENYISGNQYLIAHLHTLLNTQQIQFNLSNWNEIFERLLSDRFHKHLTFPLQLIN
jgi:hypothetical protein